MKNAHGVVKDKEAIEDSVFYHNYKKMKEEMQRYSKLEEIRNEDSWDIQKYFEVKSLAKVRVAFRIRSKIIQTIKMNFKNMQADLNCDKCELGLLDTQEHTKIYEGWEEERRGLDLEQLEDTVEFLTRILK